MMDDISNKVTVENKRTDIKTLVSADDVFIRAHNEEETKLNQWDCHKEILTRQSLCVFQET
jgi:hypothetical protein